MAKSLTDAIKEIQTLIVKLDGIKGAPQYPPDSISQYPFAIAFPGAGTSTKEAAQQKRGLHQVTLEIHYPRQNIAKAVEVMTKYEDLVTDTLWADANATLNSTVDTINEISYEFGPLGYDDIDTIGYSFVIDVKIRDTV